MLYISSRVWVLSTPNAGWNLLFPFLHIFEGFWCKNDKDEVKISIFLPFPQILVNTLENWWKRLFRYNNLFKTGKKQKFCFFVSFLIMGFKSFYVRFLGCYKSIFVFTSGWEWSQKHIVFLIFLFCIKILQKHAKYSKSWFQLLVGVCAQHPNAGQNIQQPS